MKLHSNRYVVLIAAIIMNLCLGSIFGWSILASQFQVENPDWTLSQIAAVFSLLIFTLTIATIFAGRLQDKIGPKWVAVTGGILMGSGVIIAGLVHEIWTLYISYSIISGTGIGFSVVATLACVGKWFLPQQRGLIMGMVTGSFGAGGLVSGPLAAVLINLTGTVYTTLVILGIIYLLAITLSALLIDNPPAGYQVSDIEAGGKENNFTTKEMLKDRRFYTLWMLFFLGGAAGITVISNAQQLAQSFTHISGALLVSVVGILSIFNGTGSPLFGYLSDKVGRKNALTILFSICGVSMFALPFTSTYVSFLLVSSLIITCYGGLFGIFPSASADYFGTRNLGMNYGLLYLGYGVSALIGPGIAARFVDNARQTAEIAGASVEQINTAIQAGYSQAIWLYGAACLLAVVLTVLFLKNPISKQS
ncbi:MAG: OFA family MFS transporter [Syntrophomonadaceae bacterium]|jgi:OFA family oxalate/formate antiporter-like MFS transporter|nr:OFA family MFS transporter [Syntrophomonadaceae bacterium]